MKKNKSINPLLIFDMDGTLYNFVEGSFKNSGLQKIILINALKYIMKKLRKTNVEARQILKEINKEFGEDISIALEKKYNLDRFKYFNEVWDIPDKKYIKPNPGLRKLLIDLKRKYDFAVVSDAPMIWISRVLQELKIDDIFKNRIFSGETDTRKEFGNYFPKIIQHYKVKPSNCFVVGDQEKTDILPANKMGMKTIYVNTVNRSKIADFNINNILQIKKILE
jgi:putative hydrolase of the HAD superfamily